ncbi:MAG: ABC transporter substrate-binding protein [Inquilinus sp.]|nr:ABC transporter substrate-binding protein [Inquilinus sp.]
MHPRLTAVAAAAVLAVAAHPASAETLRFAFQGDVGTLDPHGLNETFTLGFQGNIYEGLTRRGSDLAIEPALAERWEIVEPTRWRFHLRQGVTFHNGNPFTADDVVFSAERTLKDGSNLVTRLSGVAEVVKVDDHTVDFVTKVPNPILISDWDTWYIMDKEWAEANDTAEPTSASDTSSENYANRHANGTGPFMVTVREPDVRTVAVPNPNWWDEATHDLTEIVFQPIASDPTRVAALLSGEMDLVYPVPLQDVQRVDGNPGTTALTGPELRTIFLGMDQSRDELLYSSVAGTNPFKDRRVRQAFYQAIDTDAISRVVMRGQSTPAASMVAPGIIGFPEGLARHPFDAEAAKALLAAAGYADGFEVTLDCPNDRYVNDEAICQAVVGMLGRVGIKVDLLAQSKVQYFAKVLDTGGYDTSFYLLGWTPGSFDSWNALHNLVGTRNTDSGRGTFNLGGYTSPAIDALADRILVETDLEKRDALIDEAWQTLHEDVGYIPVHQQALSWGVRDGVELAQRADNVFSWRFVTIGG